MEIEKILRETPLQEGEKNIVFRGVVQLAKADGELDPREREYLAQVIAEFFPGARLDDLLASHKDLEKDEIRFSTQDAGRAFVAFLYMIAYADEDFSDAERALLTNLTQGLMPAGDIEAIAKAVRKYLYRRAVFHFALNANFLHPEFAREMARRFELDEETAVLLNRDVYEAILVLRAGELRQEIGA